MPIKLTTERRVATTHQPPPRDHFCLDDRDDYQIWREFQIRGRYFSLEARTSFGKNRCACVALRVVTTKLRVESCCSSPPQQVITAMLSRRVLSSLIVPAASRRFAAVPLRFQSTSAWSKVEKGPEDPIVCKHPYHPIPFTTL